MLIVILAEFHWMKFSQFLLDDLSFRRLKRIWSHHIYEEFVNPQSIEYSDDSQLNIRFGWSIPFGAMRGAYRRSRCQYQWCHNRMCLWCLWKRLDVFEIEDSGMFFRTFLPSFHWGRSWGRPGGIHSFLFAKFRCGASEVHFYWRVWECTRGQSFCSKLQKVLDIRFPARSMKDLQDVGFLLGKIQAKYSLTFSDCRRCKLLRGRNNRRGWDCYRGLLWIVFQGLSRGRANLHSLNQIFKCLLHIPCGLINAKRSIIHSSGGVFLRIFVKVSELE